MALHGSTFLLSAYEQREATGLKACSLRLGAKEMRFSSVFSIKKQNMINIVIIFFIIIFAMGKQTPKCNLPRGFVSYLYVFKCY